MERLTSELPFQPGEASWASWKCGGGPHTKDFEEPVVVGAEGVANKPQPVFDADAIVFEAVKLRGTQADRRAYGLEA